MLFDLFIQHRDMFPPKFRTYVQRARLFQFDLMPTETMCGFSTDLIDGLSYDFFLPFPVVAVEDKVSCVIVADIEKESIGLNVPRIFMEVAPLVNYTKDGAYKLQSTATDDEITKDKERRDMLAKHMQEGTAYPHVVRYGFTHIEWSTEYKKWKAYSKLGGSFIIRKDGIYDMTKIPTLKMDDIVDDFCRACVTAYEELIHLSSPQKFILMTMNKSNDNKQHIKYKLARERPLYTVLTPQQIRKIIKKDEPIPEHDKQGRVILERRAHIRREHTRTLKNEKFKDKIGQVINVKRAFVPAIWRGEYEHEDSINRYRVLLDISANMKSKFGL